MQSDDKIDRFNRRNLFRGGAQTAASAALGNVQPLLVNPEETAKALLGLKAGLQELLATQYAIDECNLFGFLHSDYLSVEIATNPDIVKKLSDDLLIGQKKCADILPKVLDAIGNGIAFASDAANPLHDAVDKTGVLRPELLKKLVSTVSDHALDFYSELGKILPGAIAKAQKQHSAFQLLSKALAEAHPEDDASFIFYRAESLACQENWEEKFSTPDTARQFVNEWNAKCAKIHQKYDKRARKSLEKTTGQKTTLTQEEAYLTISGHAIDTAYASLRDIITLRGSAPLEKDMPFPPKEQLIIARQPEENGRLYSVPVNPHLPPKTYIVKLTKPMAERLMQIEAGNAPFPRMKPSNAESTQGAAAHYRAVAQRNADLADDLEQLKSLLAGKWASVAKMASRSGNREL